MNWEFHAVTKTDSTELIAEYRQLAVEGIEFWLDHGFEWPEKQPEAGYSEKPKGFPWWMLEPTRVRCDREPNVLPGFRQGRVG